jgi:hypothetical protein
LKVDMRQPSLRSNPWMWDTIKYKKSRLKFAISYYLVIKLILDNFFCNRSYHQSFFYQYLILLLLHLCHPITIRLSGCNPEHRGISSDVHTHTHTHTHTHNPTPIPIHTLTHSLNMQTFCTWLLTFISGTDHPIVLLHPCSFSS